MLSTRMLGRGAIACLHTLGVTLLVAGTTLSPLGIAQAEPTADAIDADDVDLFAKEELSDSDFDDADAALDEDAAGAPAPAPELAPSTAPTASPPGFDEPTSLRSEGMEEIVIRGEAAVGIEADAAVSSTSFSADDLESMGVQDVSDVAKYTPNLEIRTVGSTSPSFFIRGVGLNSFTSNASGSVAFYQDDVPLNLPGFQLAQVFDTEGIEVLKGPQGSGPGRNASAGVIRVFSRKPTGEFNSFLRFDYGNFDYIDSEGAMEVPLFKDVLSSRFAFRLTEREGLVRNRCGGLTPEQAAGSPQDRGGRCPAMSSVRPGLETDLNNLDRWAARTMLRFVPPGVDMDWLLSLHVARIDQLGTVGQNFGAADFLGGFDSDQYQQPEIAAQQQKIFAKFPIPTIAECRTSPDPAACRADRAARNTQRRNNLSRRLADNLDTKPFDGDYNNPGHERQGTYGGFLRGEWELSAASLTSISAFEIYDRELIRDADYSPNRVFEFDIADDAWQVTQELRAEGELNDLEISWGTGGFVLYEELDVDRQSLGGNQIPNIDQTYQQETLGWGIFGELVWRFADDFELEGGVRYNREHKKIESLVFRGLPGAEPRDLCAISFSDDCSDQVDPGAVTGTLSLKYFFRDDVSAYLKYTRGWKGPQFSVRDGNPPAEIIDAADPETIDAFEIGLRGTWWDGRLTLESAFFWYNYDQYQVFTFSNDVDAPPQQLVLNANNARIYGAELESRIEPLEQLIFEARAGWLESEFLDFSDTATRRIGGEDQAVEFIEATLDFNGNRLPNTPRFKLSASAEYTLELGRYGSLTPRYDVAWSDTNFFSQSNGRGAFDDLGRQFLPKDTVAQRPYAIHNARLVYRTASGNIEVVGWVRNLTNEVYKTLVFDASSQAELVGNLVGLPRTYGLSVKLSF